MSESYLQNTLSAIGNAWSVGNSDIMAIIRNSPREFTTPATYADIQGKNIVAAKSFELNYEQSVVNSERLAGEGAETNTFMVGLAGIKSTMISPLYFPVTGWAHPVFAQLWDATKLALWGVGTSSAALTTQASALGATELVINNIMEFIDFTTPFSLEIIGLAGETSETVSVTNVDKLHRKLVLSAGTSHLHSNGTLVYSLPNNSGGARVDPAFSILSLKYGLMAPTLVDSISIQATMENPLEYKAQFLSLGIDKAPQIEMRAHYAELIDAFAQQPPDYLLSPVSLAVGTVSGSTGTYGLPTALGDPLFAGFQGLGIPPISIVGFSLEINNHLEAVYTTHSMQTTTNIKRRENSYPQTIVSAGRTIKGTLTYKAPIAPYALLERIAGNSDLNNGGLVFYLGPCKITMPEIAWKPSTAKTEADGVHERTLEWEMTAQSFDSMPYLDKS